VFGGEELGEGDALLAGYSGKSELLQNQACLAGKRTER
jgi:hypothetical protein